VFKTERRGLIANGKKQPSNQTFGLASEGIVAQIGPPVPLLNKIRFFVTVSSIAFVEMLPACQTNR